MIFSQYFFFIAVGVGCYLIGAIPISYLLGRFWAKIDIRTHGSRNVGASNLAVHGGKNIGIIAGVMDCLIKGTFAWYDLKNSLACSSLLMPNCVCNFACPIP